MLIRRAFLLSVLGITFLLPTPGLLGLSGLLWEPILFFEGLEPSPQFLEGFNLGWRGILLVAVLLPRNPLVLFLAFLSSFYGFGLINCFGAEIEALAPLVLGVLAALLTCRSPRAEVHFPFLLKTILVVLFFSSALSKIVHGGFGWAFSGDILVYMSALSVLNQDVLGLPQLTTVQSYLLANETLLNLGAVGIHLFEFTTPAALFSKRASKLFAWGALGFILFNMLVLGINFLTVVPLILVWLVRDHTLDEVGGKVHAALAGWMALQLFATMVARDNFFPIMANEMYARKPPMPLVTNLTVEVASPKRVLEKSSELYPLVKYQLFSLLFKKKDPTWRRELMCGVLEAYQSRCGDACPEVTTLRALVHQGEQVKELARCGSK